MSNIIWHFILLIYYTYNLMMKKIIISFLILLIFASCSKDIADSPIKDEGVVDTPSVTETTNF